MRHPTAFSAAALVVAFAVFLISLTPTPALAKNSEWIDLAGVRFRGEPVDVLGPFALFRTSLTTGRRVRLRGFSPETIQRFHAEIAARPSRAARWAEATASATREIIDHAFVVQNNQLVPANFTDVPEPEMLLVLYGSHNDGESWQMVQNITSVYQRFQRVYPGEIATIFMGVRHSATEHSRIATVTRMPWLVADFFTQNSMSTLHRFVPAEGAQLLLLSRHGVPLLSARGSSFGEIKKFADDLSALLAALDSSNPRSWPDRYHYLNIIRPLDFAGKSTGPLLLGNPLRPDGLRQRGVARVEAHLTLADDGSVTQVDFTAGAQIPEPMKAPLVEALRKQAAFLPAIDNGKTVASSYDYTYVVPPENKVLSADTAWLNGEARNEIPLPSWLVLRPVQVQEKDFSNEVDHVASDETVMLKALEVSSSKVSRTAQMSAFNSDWFAEAGPGTVHPKEGDAQRIDGTMLTWKRLAATDGLVDFGVHDYSIGYAWTEFESSVDTDAWLGLGSDDGVKVWLNGELINDRWTRRISRLDDEVIRLRLKKGKNQLLIKIQNATGDWSFITRLRTR